MKSINILILVQAAGSKLVSSENDFVFLHIVKSGGTSFDRTMKPIIDRLGMKYRGSSHFDHSWIDFKYRDQNRDQKPKVVTLLRDPIDRIISNFHHAKTLEVFQNSPIVNQTIEEYIQDTDTVCERGRGALSERNTREKYRRFAIQNLVNQRQTTCLSATRTSFF